MSSTASASTRRWRRSGLAPQPDLLLVTGDIANDGDDSQSYQRYREALADLAFPAYPLMGNHDSRAPFLELFPEVPNVEGFIQYAIEDWPLHPRPRHARGRPSAAAAYARSARHGCARGSTRRPTARP